MSKLFNTPFESGVRSLLVLYTISPAIASIDRIAAYDFISIYGKDFGISDFNLHGNNYFNFSEFPAKRLLIQQGTKEMALDGMIKIIHSSSGFMYQLSENGFSYVKSLDTDYSSQYLDMLKKVHAAYQAEPDAKLMELINIKALSTLRR